MSNAMRIGVIRALTTTDPRLLNTHARALQAAYGFDTVSRCLPDLPAGVHDDASFARAVPQVEALAREMSDDVDAIIISCITDPGLEEARRAAGVPVIGAGSAAAATALALGGPVGVLGLAPTAPTPITRILGDRLVAVEAVESAHETLELLTPTGVFDTFAAAERLVADGAEVILLGSGGLTTIGVAPELRRRTGRPVIDAVLAAGAVLASGSNAPQLVTL